jgi:hypothetical protein
VRLRFGGAATTANMVPANWGPGMWRVDLAHPGAGPDDIGGELGPVSYVGAIPTGAGQLVPISRTVATDFFVLGECPGALSVSKFLDGNGNGVRDGDEPALAGWTITLTPDSTDSAGAEHGVDTSVRSAVTDVNGTAIFSLWPGQVATVVETLPDARDIPIPDYAPTVATLSWTPTTAGGTTQVLPMSGFETTTTASFGNRCACATDTNACVDATCVASVEDPALATCTWQQTGPTCGTATDLCAVGDGRCDPTTGTCVWDEAPCGPSVPTRVYVPIADAKGVLVGSAICHIDHAPDGVGVEAIRCDTTEENGETVLLLVDVNHCGE